MIRFFKKEGDKMPDEKDNGYNEKIKQRLKEWLDNLRDHGFELNFKQLHENMEDIYHIKTSEQKIRQMFDPTKSREIKLRELAALAHMLQIPLSSLCEFPNTPAVMLERPWIYSKECSGKSSGISTLINDFYNGDYFAYYFKPKHFDRLDLGGKEPVSGSIIEEAKIEIKIEKGEPYVILKELSSSRDFYDQKVLDRFVLKGKLYLIENSNIAYSFIIDDEARRAIALMFEYRNFNKDILYYRTAAMLTISLNEQHKPLFQKIALFRVRQDLTDKENEDILRGILALNTGPIMIEKEVFDKAKTSEEYSKYKLNTLEPKSKEYYIFSEPAIRDSFQNWSADESVKILLKLREMSIFQAHEIISETEYFGTFIKEYQQAHKNFPLSIKNLPG